MQISFDAEVAGLQNYLQKNLKFCIAYNNLQQMS